MEDRNGHCPQQTQQTGLQLTQSLPTHRLDGMHG